MGDERVPDDDREGADNGVALLASTAVFLRALLVDGQLAGSTAIEDVVSRLLVDLEPQLADRGVPVPPPHEALLRVLDAVSGRLLDPDDFGMIERLRIEALAVVGRHIVGAFVPEVAADAAPTLGRLEDVGSDDASSTALALLKGRLDWLLHPLVVLQVGRWCAATTVKRRAGYVPLRYRDGHAFRTQDAERLEALVDLLQVPAASARGDKVEPAAFRRIYREVQEEVARVRAAFLSWLNSGEVIPEVVTIAADVATMRDRLREPTWLSDEALAEVCEDKLNGRSCIDIELRHQYRDCRSGLSLRTVRGWAAKYVPKAWRPIPDRWIEELAGRPADEWLLPVPPARSRTAGRRRSRSTARPDRGDPSR